MEEITVIKSKRFNIKIIFLGFVIVAAIIGLILWFAVCHKYYEGRLLIHENDNCLNGTQRKKLYGWSQAPCKFLPIQCAFYCRPWLWFPFLVFLGVSLLGLFFCLILKNMEIIVTNKRVTGKTYFGKTVDLPLDSISAVGSKWLKGIAVATSSGKISFLLIKNAKEIHEEIRKLLIERQEKKALTQSSTVATISTVDELKQYKELYDNGIITQEEFEQKKKHLLGL